MTQLARDLAVILLADDRFLESATFILQTDGRRNEHGEWVPGEIIENEVRLITHPIPEESRDTVPEGYRLKDLRFFYTKEDLQPTEEDRNQGDEIRYMGTTYRIISVKDWVGFREILGNREESQQ